MTAKTSKPQLLRDDNLHHVDHETVRDTGGQSAESGKVDASQTDSVGQAETQATGDLPGACWRSNLYAVSLPALRAWVRDNTERGGPRSMSRADFRDYDAAVRCLARRDYVADACAVEWCTSRAYGEQLPEGFYERQAADRALELGVCVLLVDATRPDVAVPDRFKARTDLRLAVRHDNPDDLWTDERGLSGTLKFGSEHAECFIPWSAVLSVGAST